MQTQSTSTRIALTSLPQNWAITPVNGRKAPYRDNWQNESPLTLDAIAADLRSGKAKGVGVRLGPVSGGLLAVDVDGTAAHDLLLTMGVLPPTATITSGWHLNRYCHFLHVPEQYWEAIHSRKLKTGAKEPGWDGKLKASDLELRWDGAQQVILGAHPSGSQYQWVRHPNQGIAIAPDWLIEKMLKDSEPAPTKPAPLLAYDARTDLDWAREYLPFVPPAMADDYNEWIAVGTALRSVSDALYPDWVEWSRQSPKFDGRGLEAKWRSFKSDDAYALAKLGDWAKQGGWQSRKRDDDRPRSHSAIKRDKPATNGHNPDPSPDLLALIRLALTEGLTDTQLELRRAELSHASGYSDKSFNAVWARVESDLAREEDRDSNRHKVTSLLGKDRPPFDLVRFLGEIGKPLAWIANAQNMRHESYLFAILAATGGIAQNGTKLCIHRGMNFYVTPNSFFAIVSPPSQRKSPLIDTAVTDAFRVIQSRLTAHYKADLAQWEDEGSKGKPPQERLIYFSKPSGESLPMQAQRFPQQGLTWIRDELSGIFAGANQYRNGLGSDLQDLLEYHDGRGPVVLRVDGVRARQDFHLSIIGGVQPEIIRELIGNDAADHDGKWSRFMFVSQPVAPATLPDADGGWVDTTEMLAGIYERVMLTPAAIYTLSREAFRFYQEVYNNLEKQRASESHAATAAAIGKLEGRIGKLALSLHLFHAAATGQPPAKEIPLETVISATELAEISLEELKALYADAAQELPAKLKRLLDLAQRKGERGLSVREACQSFSGKAKPKAPEVRTMFQELEAMGLATFKDGVLLRKD